MGYFEKTQPTYKVSVLGTEYSVYTGVSVKDDPYLKKCDGYCDKTLKRIVVACADEDNELGNYEVYAKTNLRHELTHAFLFESGLDGNSCWGNGESDHSEQLVEWMAVQFPKMMKAFSKVNAL